jgi:hypothetical protein
VGPWARLRAAAKVVAAKVVGAKVVEATVVGAMPGRSAAR